MNLYFNPLSCSMATKIALRDAGLEARLIYVDGKTKRTEDGADFRAVNPLGMVPVLRTDDGEIITENAAILMHVAELGGRAGTGVERTRLTMWVSFVATELHKGVFTPLFDPATPDEVKAHVREKGESRFDLLDRHLSGREFLLDRFTVADAYLTTVLNWTGFTGIDLGRWPNLAAYHRRLLKHPSVEPVFSKDREHYAEEQARKAA